MFFASMIVHSPKIRRNAFVVMRLWHSSRGNFTLRHHYTLRRITSDSFETPTSCNRIVGDVFPNINKSESLPEPVYPSFQSFNPRPRVCPSVSLDITPLSLAYGSYSDRWFVVHKPYGWIVKRHGSPAQSFVDSSCKQFLNSSNMAPCVSSVLQSFVPGKDLQYPLLLDQDVEGLLIVTTDKHMYKAFRLLFDQRKAQCTFRALTHVRPQVITSVKTKYECVSYPKNSFLRDWSAADNAEYISVHNKIIPRSMNTGYTVSFNGGRCKVKSYKVADDTASDRTGLQILLSYLRESCQNDVPLRVADSPYNESFRQPHTEVSTNFLLAANSERRNNYVVNDTSVVPEASCTSLDSHFWELTDVSCIRGCMSAGCYALRNLSISSDYVFVDNIPAFRSSCSNEPSTDIKSDTSHNLVDTYISHGLQDVLGFQNCVATPAQNLTATNSVRRKLLGRYMNGDYMPPLLSNKLYKYRWPASTENESFFGSSDRVAGSNLIAKAKYEKKSLTLKHQPAHCHADNKPAHFLKLKSVCTLYCPSETSPYSKADDEEIRACTSLYEIKTGSSSISTSNVHNIRSLLSELNMPVIGDRLYHPLLYNYYSSYYESFSSVKPVYEHIPSSRSGGDPYGWIPSTKQPNAVFDKAENSTTDGRKSRMGSAKRARNESYYDHICSPQNESSLSSNCTYEDVRSMYVEDIHQANLNRSRYNVSNTCLTSSTETSPYDGGRRKTFIRTKSAGTAPSCFTVEPACTKETVLSLSPSPLPSCSRHEAIESVGYSGENNEPAENTNAIAKSKVYWTVEEFVANTDASDDNAFANSRALDSNPNNRIRVSCNAVKKLVYSRLYDKKLDKGVGFLSYDTVDKSGSVNTEKLHEIKNREIKIDKWLNKSPLCLQLYRLEFIDPFAPTSSRAIKIEIEPPSHWFSYHPSNILASSEERNENVRESVYERLRSVSSIKGTLEDKERTGDEYDSDHDDYYHKEDVFKYDIK